MAFAIIWFVALAAAFFFFIVVPQRRRTQTQRALIAGLEVGNEIVTTGGLYGTIRALEPDSVLLEVADGVVVKAARAAVIGVVAPPGSDGEAA